MYIEIVVDSNMFRYDLYMSSILKHMALLQHCHGFAMHGVVQLHQSTVGRPPKLFKPTRLPRLPRLPRRQEPQKL